MAQRDLEILDDAIAALRKETDLRVEKGRMEVRVAGRLVDATIQIETPKKRIEYLVEIRPNIAEQTIGNLAQQLEETPGRWIIVTRHVPANLAKKMKELNIQFIDAAGNAYLNEKPFLIFMYGNKAAEGFKKERSEGIWGRAGVKIVFALFCQPNLVNATYREIADQADVALGTVAGMFKDLARQGYALDLGNRGRKLQRKKELFDNWAAAYAQKLRPKTLIGRYTTDKPEFWQEGDLVRHNAYWGGEVAADRITHYLKPEIVTIYANKPVNDLVLDLKLRKKEEGNIEIREKFWRTETEGLKDSLVHPILIYADLMAEANARNIETAKMIYADLLAGHLAEG